MSNGDFITSLYPYASRVSSMTGLDPRLILAQAALETGWGRSAPGQNYFGIKGGGGDGLLTTEYVNGRPVQVREPFRSYESPEQSFLDYANLMMRPRYEGVRGAGSLEAQAEALQAAGYATDPEYAAKLIQIASNIPQSDGRAVADRAMVMLGRTQPRQAGAVNMDNLLGFSPVNDQPAMRPAVQPAPQGGGLGAFFRDPAMLENLALAFNTMRLTPDPALAQLIQGRQERRETKATRNRTVEFLRQRGRNDLADAVESGAIDAQTAAAQVLTPTQPTKGIAVGERIIDPVTGRVIYEPTGVSAVKPEDIANARKEFTALPAVKTFADQTSSYGRIISSVEDPSPAGDLALIFNFMKVLDPGSVVREGEFATAANAGGVDERVRGLYNRVISGERLTPEQRADFADRATRLYSGAQQQYQKLADQYGSFARAAGLPVEQVIPDFGYSGGLYEKPLEFRRPPPPTGVTEQDWALAWSNMTDEERRQFLDRGDR